MNRSVVIAPLPSVTDVLDVPQVQHFPIPTLLTLSVNKGIGYQKKKALKVISLLDNFQ
jgi:hypothetical protein